MPRCLRGIALTPAVVEVISKASRALALIIHGLILGYPSILLAQEPDSIPDTRPSIRLNMEWPGQLELRRVPALEPGGRLGVRVLPQTYSGRWAEEVRQEIAANRAASRETRVLTMLASLGGRSERARRRLDIAAPTQTGGRGPDDPFGVVSDLVDLGIQMRARIELDFDRLKNESCTTGDIAALVSGCEGGFPTPSLAQRFQLRAGGIVSQRVNLNVDFDADREFDSSNDIRVWYQGLDDEIVRRVEIGNVSFNTPTSRFITSAIPANSFGISAEAQVGGFDFKGIFAQQGGSDIRQRTFTVGETTSRPVSREIRDLDFESGRFFSVRDPRTLPGYPEIDLLELNSIFLAPDERIAEVRIYRAQAQAGSVIDNPNLGGIEAVARRDDSNQRVGPIPWQLLIEGRDYYVDASGLWFGLSSRVRSDEFLAVSYITASGDTIGTFPSVDGGQDTLELIYEPLRGPEVPTFFHELRNLYRVSGEDLDRATLDLRVVVNDSDRPLDGQGTYLSRLGISVSNDAGTFDQFNRLFPRDRDPGQGEPLRDFFLVYPHLQPFADSLRLQEGERNDSLYRTPVYLLESEGPPATLRMEAQFETAGGGDRSSVNLGALEIREGSERIFVNNRRLTRNREYDIDYQLGVVSFLNPDSLFPTPTEVIVQFEENTAFSVASKSIFGLSTTYNIGTSGRINAIGLMQRESTRSTRPQLGQEPQASFIGGLSSEFDFQVDAITDIMDALPLVETRVPSTVRLSGEIAMSRPNPNQVGAVFIEDFEGSGLGTRSIPLNESRFSLGSRPSSGRGLNPLLLSAGQFADLQAVPLVWQNIVQAGQTNFLTFLPTQVDPSIQQVGTGTNTETVMWMTLLPDTVAGGPRPVNDPSGTPRWFREHTPGPRWRSLTTPLSASSVGEDLSRIEFLEFWVLEDPDRSARNQDAVVVFDFGTVFEDALALAPDSFNVVDGDTIFSGIQVVGRGVLDSERDSLTNIFNAARDDVGIHQDRVPSIINSNTGEVINDFSMCSAPLDGLVAFPRGDLAARCTRFNRLLDTEDLDGDNRLDQTVGTVQEDLFRFVFPVGSDRYFVRNGGQVAVSGDTPWVWRLYRIPFRSDTVQVGQPNVRRVRAMRMTVVAPDNGPQEEEVFFAMARMRLLGAPWIKRAETPIEGIAGADGEPHGEVIASVVTTENRDLGYSSPPGVTDQAAFAGAGLSFGAIQVNEKSLRLLARDLRGGERAEALFRFTDETDKNFLNYRTMRVWARGRGPGWEDGDLQFFVKVGRDDNNFYMYRTSARTVSWEPEVRINLQRWLLLRAELEARWLRGEAPSGSAECGGDPDAFVICDGPYVVHILDPGVAPPNLARVSEIAVGMYRQDETVFIDRAELWVDDIRLDDVVDDPGYAGALEGRVTAADVAELGFTYTSRDGNFRQLTEDPSYVGSTAAQFNSILRLHKFLPQSWGLNVEARATLTNTDDTPFYLNRSDVLASALEDLRDPRSSAELYTAAVSKPRRGQSFIVRNLVDPISLSGSYQTAENITLLGESESRNQRARLSYQLRPERKTVRVAPRFLRGFVSSLPSFISESEFGRALQNSRLRYNPLQVGLTTTLTDNITTQRSFRVPVIVATDTSLGSNVRVIKTLSSDVSVRLQPFTTMQLGGSFGSTRDLQNYGDSTTVGRLLRTQRREFAGMGVGFERQRSFGTSFSVRPVINTWLRPSVRLESSFNLTRDPTSRTAVRTEGDSTGAFKVPEAIGNRRLTELSSNFDLYRMVESVFGSGFPSRLVRGVELATVSWRRERTSAFDRVPFETDLRYRLALGGLDEFLSQNGVTATSATNSETWTLTAGTRLPLGCADHCELQRVGQPDIFKTRRESIQDFEQQSHLAFGNGVLDVHSTWFCEQPPFRVLRQKQIPKNG